MIRFLMIVVCCCAGFSTGRKHLPDEEGACFSRFDYEYKVVQKLVQLEEGHEKLSKIILTQREEISALKTLADDKTEKLVRVEEGHEEMSKLIQTQREEISALKTLADDKTEKLVRVEEGHEEMSKLIQTQREQISTLQTQADDAARIVSLLERKLLSNGVDGGSTYIRWGKTSCPGNGAELVYPGYAGGSYYTHKGAAASYLCLPQDPLWGKYDDSLQDEGLVYGAEYEPFGALFSDIAVHEDVPCAVCRSSRPSVLMIPARNECYGNWTLEYHGYLMTGNYDHAAASDFACVDAQAEAAAGGNSKGDHGKLFYQAEARCGSLQCPPYVNGRELTCVVCSR